MITENPNDLIIIGGGPAGCAAGVYAGRKRLKTVLIAEEFAGQSSASEDIQNWIGTVSISGAKLALSLEAHVNAYAGNALVVKKERAEKIEFIDGLFRVSAGNDLYAARAVLVATGSHRRKLEAKGADIFEHKGLTYCASCDGPLFSGKDLAVIGGGNAAFETAAQLLAYAKSVAIIHRGDSFNRVDFITVEKVASDANMRIIKNAEILEISGDKFVSGIAYIDKKTEEKKEISVEGVFVEIGQIPNTEFLNGFVSLNESGSIIVDPRTQKTSVPGVWAAGDCADVLYHQNNIAAGDGIRALEDIYVTLKTK